MTRLRVHKIFRVSCDFTSCPINSVSSKIFPVSSQSITRFCEFTHYVANCVCEITKQFPFCDITQYYLNLCEITIYIQKYVNSHMPLGSPCHNTIIILSYHSIASYCTAARRRITAAAAARRRYYRHSCLHTRHHCPPFSSFTPPSF